MPRVDAKPQSRFGFANFQLQTSRRPCIDSAGERTNSGYAAFLQLHRDLCCCRFVRTRAIHDDVAVSRNFGQTTFDVIEVDQSRAGYAAAVELSLCARAHVENERFVAPIHHFIKLRDADPRCAKASAKPPSVPPAI